MKAFWPNNCLAAIGPLTVDRHQHLNEPFLFGRCVMWRPNVVQTNPGNVQCYKGDKLCICARSWWGSIQSWTNNPSSLKVRTPTLGPAHQKLPRAKIRSGEIYREPARIVTSISIHQISTPPDDHGKNFLTPVQQSSCD